MKYRDDTTISHSKTGFEFYGPSFYNVQSCEIPAFKYCCFKPGTCLRLLNPWPILANGNETISIRELSEDATKLNAINGIRSEASSQKFTSHMLSTPRRHLPAIACDPSKKVVRHSFNPNEDARLVELVTQSPGLSWSDIARCIPGRSARQCRERWGEYLRPGIRVEPWTDAEDDLLLRQVEILGHRWTAIATAFARRSANDVKNRWYSHLQCAAFVRPDGRLDLLRSTDGSIVTGKPRRNRRQTMPGRTAFEALDEKRREELEQADKRQKRVRLPQLCPDDFKRLMIDGFT
jgi:hypothetical protein